jgi:hypothetical protein
MIDSAVWDSESPNMKQKLKHVVVMILVVISVCAVRVCETWLYYCPWRTMIRGLWRDSLNRLLLWLIVLRVGDREPEYGREIETCGCDEIGRDDIGCDICMCCTCAWHEQNIIVLMPCYWRFTLPVSGTGVRRVLSPFYNYKYSLNYLIVLCIYLFFFYFLDIILPVYVVWTSICEIGNKNNCA